VSVPWRKKEENGGPPEPPERLSQRWAIILGFGVLTTVAVAQVGPILMAVSTGLVVVGLLHSIMD
jgi:hypothetical protein